MAQDLHVRGRAWSLLENRMQREGKEQAQALIEQRALFLSQQALFASLSRELTAGWEALQSANKYFHTAWGIFERIEEGLTAAGNTLGYDLKLEREDPDGNPYDWFHGVQLSASGNSEAAASTQGDSVPAQYGRIAETYEDDAKDRADDVRHEQDRTPERDSVSPSEEVSKKRSLSSELASTP